MFCFIPPRADGLRNSLKQKPEVVVAIATKNEAQTIGPLLAALRDYPVVIVDDSDDQTLEIAVRRSNVIAAKHGTRAGVAAAYWLVLATACKYSGRHVVQMDAGFSHNPADIAPMLDLAIQNRWVLTTGSRFVGRRIPTSFRMGISMLGALAARSLGLPIHDATCGFRVWDAKILSHILLHPLHSKGNGFQLEMLYRAAQYGDIGEMPIAYRSSNTHFGLWMIPDALRAYRHLLVNRIENAKYRRLYP